MAGKKYAGANIMDGQGNAACPHPFITDQGKRTGVPLKTPQFDGSPISGAKSSKNRIAPGLTTGEDLNGGGGTMGKGGAPKGL